MNPLLQLVACCTVFFGLVFGLGLPIAAGFRLPAVERVAASAAIGLVLLYLAGLLIYWTGLPWTGIWSLAALAVLLTLVRFQACRSLLADPEVRHLVSGYLIVAGWSLAFLALVSNYSGARWAIDWANHYERSYLFLQHGSATNEIVPGDILPSRPPLANMATASLLALAGNAFPHFQIMTALLSTLAFLPGWLWARRFGGAGFAAPSLFTLLYLLNPSVLENTTFAWTKLVTVYFVLTGFYFLLPAAREISGLRVGMAFALFAAGILSHYSAGPYVVMAIVGYLYWRRSTWFTAAFWREAIVGCLPSVLLLSTWFVWSIRVFGFDETFFSNTSVTETEVHSLGSFIQEKGLNLLDSLVPHFLRPVDYAFIAQESRLGYWRDYFFLLYQVNLPLLFGSVGAVLLIVLLRREWMGTSPDATGPSRSFWLWFIVGVIVLGTAASGGPTDFGIAHLCLQGLLVLGLAYLAARAPSLSRGLRIAWAVGVGVDFVLGIGLQFYFENIHFSPLRFLTNEGDDVLRIYGPGTWVNLRTKVLLGVDFVGDWPISRPLLLTLIACLLALALLRLRRRVESHPVPIPTESAST